jgi:DNA-binding MarR family transcriptional regulator
MVSAERVEETAAATEAFGHAFKGAMAAVRRLRGRDTQRSGEIGYAHHALLAELATRGEVSASDLAAAAGLAPSSVTQMLDQLSELGLVVRTRSTEDRRVVASRLTPAGRELVTARRARIQPLWDAALAEFTPAELLAAAGVLERVRGLFETLDIVPGPAVEHEGAQPAAEHAGAQSPG